MRRRDLACQRQQGFDLRAHRLGVARTYVAASIDAGATWQTTDPRLDTGAGQTVTPAVVRALNGALVAWIDFRTDPRVFGDPYVVRVGR